jgi:hypothetical protein
VVSFFLRTFAPELETNNSNKQLKQSNYDNYREIKGNREQ